MKYTNITLIIAVSFWFGYWLSSQARPDETAERHIAAQQKYIAELKNRTVTEQMISIQKQVGCKILDGKAGPEMTPLVNAKVDEEKPEYMNKCAMESLRLMAGDKK